MRARATCLLLAWTGVLWACAGPPDASSLWRSLLGRAGPGPELIEQPAAGLPAPEGLRAQGGGFRQVRLEWEPLLAGRVGGYAVERADGADGPWQRVAVLPDRFATHFVDAGGGEDGPGPLGDGATAYYRVRAFAPSGHLAAAASEPVVATTAPEPGPPTDLRAYSIQPRMVPLSWSAPENPNVAGYLVERSPSSRGPFETIARLSGRDATAFVDRGLGDLRALYYRVAALNPAGAAGPPSAPVRAVTKPEPLPPYQLHVREQRLGANRIAWDPNVEPDLAGYRVLRGRAPGDDPELVDALPPDETSALDTDVAASETLWYSVVAVDRDGLESAPAEPIELESEGYALSARVEAGGVALRWNPRREEGWERARVQRSGRLQTRDLGVVEGDRYVDTEVAPGDRYLYTVVLERGDSTRAPPSRPVEVVIPES